MIRWAREFVDLGLRAMVQFPDLGECEFKVLCAASLGLEARFGRTDPDPHAQNEDNPEFGEEWGIERHVRADFIRWLCVDRTVAPLIDPRGIQIRAARITGRLDLSYASIKFPLFLRRCRIDEEMKLAYARIAYVEIPASYCAGIDGDGLTVDGDLLLTDGFHSKAKVSLSGARIGQDLDCSGGEFRTTCDKALIADNAKITGNVYLIDGFRAFGEVTMLAAEIGGSLYCDRTRLSNPGDNALSADGLSVAGDIILSSGFFEGNVRLIGASVDGNLECEAAKFVAGSRLDAQQANIAGTFVWTGVSNIGATETASLSLDLGQASVGRFEDDIESWPRKGGLVLNGLEYGRIANGPTDAKARLQWLAKQGGSLRPQPYQHLVKIMREIGDDAGAKQVLISFEDEHRKQETNVFRRLWRGVLKYTIAYGYRPYYALGWAVLVVLIGACLFGRGRSAGIVAPSDKDAYQFFTDNAHLAPIYYPRFSSPVYSLDAFLPIINLGLKDHWTPNANLGVRVLGHTGGWWLRDYLWVHIILGWVLTTLFVAGISGVVSRRL